MMNQTIANRNTSRFGSPASYDLPQQRFVMKVIHDVQELEQMSPLWEQLIESAIEPNPFFDPDFLIPAIEYLAKDNIYVLVATTRIDEQEIVCGLMPISEQKRPGRRLPEIRVWTYDSNFDATPLIRREVANQTLSFIFDWLSENLGLSSFDINSFALDGEFETTLQQVLSSQGRTVQQNEPFFKRCFEPQENTLNYITNCVREPIRQCAQNAYRKLCERGAVSTAVSTSVDASWVEPFLRLEASAANMRSVDVTEKHAHGCFFRAIADRMLPKGKMTLLRTTLTGQPIAMACEISHRDGCKVLFKQAVMNSLRSLNPGLILQFENLQRLHDGGVDTCISCVADSDSNLNGVWDKKKSYASMSVSLTNNPTAQQRKRPPVLKKIGRYFRKS